MTGMARRPRGLFLASAAAAGAIVLVTLLTTRGAERRTTCRATLIPAYVPPHALVELARASSRPRLLVINPSNGPGAEPTPAYRAAVRTAQRAGARVLGYVHTTYGARPARDVMTDIDRYTSWYGVDGIFLDEAAHDVARVGYYAALGHHVRSGGAGRVVVLNPGVVPAWEYFDLADVIVTFEGPYAAYGAAMDATPDWVRDQPPGRVAHLVYDASRQQAMATVSHPHKAGYVYATSGSMPDPWRTVPSYLHEEEHALEVCA
ncbi:MAG: spherulation-specific family 4 protein [Solirubrobacteraceae bacterium]